MKKRIMDGKTIIVILGISFFLIHILGIISLRIIDYVFITTSIILLTIVYHEIGHWWMYKFFGITTDIRFFGKLRQIHTGSVKDIMRLSKQQRIIVYLGGILLGLVPFLYFYPWDKYPFGIDLVFVILFLIIYSMLIFDDIKNIKDFMFRRSYKKLSR